MAARLRWIVLSVVLVTLAGCGGGGGGAGNVLFLVVTPSADGAANTAQPEVSWMAHPSAQSYRVSLFRDAALTDLIETQTVAVTRATVQTALPDGQAVHVRVEALGAFGAVVAASPTSRFRVRLLPADIPTFNVLVHDTARAHQGLRLFNVIEAVFPPPPTRNGTLVLVNMAGEVVWFHQRPSATIEDARMLPGGQVSYIYRDLIGNPPFTHAVVVDFDGNETFRSQPTVLPHHEFTLGPGGSYMYLHWLFRPVGPDIYEGDGIHIVDPATGAILWQWDIFDHLSTTLIDPIDIMDTGASGRGLDWTHSNAAVWDQARSLIWVSVRALDLMLAVDYPSGQVVERFGRDELGGLDLMSHQHAPEIQPDGQILFFDNGNRRTEQVTRVVSFDWDPAMGSVQETFSWSDTPEFYDFALGDADKLPNGNILITSGTHGHLIEITPSGDKVWELEFAAPDYWIYRAENVDESEVPTGILPFD